MPDADTIWIIVEDANWRAAVPDVRVRCRRAARAALAAGSGKSGGREATVLLADDATLRDLNGRFRGQDKATNVLSFPNDDRGAGGETPRSLGDVAVAFGTARDEARADGKPLADHLSHLVVHGMLHLLGFDHQRDDEAERMESLETEVLAALGIDSPYGRRLVG